MPFGSTSGVLRPVSNLGETDFLVLLVLINLNEVDESSDQVKNKSEWITFSPAG